MDDRTNFAVFRQMPWLINMILTDPSIHTEFQPFDVLLGRAFDADFLIAAIHDRHKILPAHTILKRAATPAFRPRSKPGKRIPPDHLLHIFHSDDRHTGLGEDRLIRIGDIAKSQAGTVPNFPIETPTSPIDMFRLGFCKRGPRRYQRNQHDQAPTPHDSFHLSLPLTSEAVPLQHQGPYPPSNRRRPVFGIAVLPVRERNPYHAMSVSRIVPEETPIRLHQQSMPLRVAAPSRQDVDRLWPTRFPVAHPADLPAADSLRGGPS